ncbi:unnamed protein product [Acanthosepion pharaonis]|uniref:Uncharacterized protein n=1 Tax=Acanthosepion pharaonis TaxID=158019 RepID=A0A812C4E6_ACAPH|nr:unnamed protein product [Sepia pharaonis]
MTLSDIRTQDFVGCHQGGVSMSKDNNVVDNSGSLSHWTELNNCTGVEREAGSRRSYNLTKEIADECIDNRSITEPAKNHLSHEVKEEEEDEEEEEEEEEATDTAPILACTRVITPHRFHTKATSKARTNNKNKITPRGSGCESINKTRGRISDPRTDTAFSRNNKCRNYKNSCTTGDCVGGDPKDCDGSHTNCFHPSPPPLISHHKTPHNLHHCCLDESQGLFSTEVFAAADVCFVKNNQVVSQGPNLNFGIAAAAGNTHNHARESLHNGSASSSLVNPVSSSLSTSFFNPTTNPTSCAVTSSNVEDFDEGGEGGLRSGVGEGGPLTNPVGRRGPTTTTCSFTSLSSASGAGCANTSSSLPAWSSPHAMGEHCHPAQASTTQVDKLARNQLIAVSALCCIFMTCEIVGK